MNLSGFEINGLFIEISWVLILAWMSTFSLILSITGHFSLFVKRGQKPPEPSAFPGVSILKPLKGLDDDLYQNLVTFARQDYPNFEILFAAEDPDDPALPVARRVQREFRHIPIRVLAAFKPIGLNPKVNNLAAMTAAARNDLLWVSDSNTRAAPDTLRAIVAEFEKPNVAAVNNAFIAVGEKTLAATLEGLHNNGVIFPSICGADIAIPYPILLGKSMTMRRDVLDRIGGWQAVANVLAEDQYMARAIDKLGMKTVLSPIAVETVNIDWELARFFNRQLRWAQIRRHLTKPVFWGEPITYTTVWMLLLFAAVQAGHEPSYVFGVSVGSLALAGIALKTLFDSLAIAHVRGEFPSVAAALLIPVKDLCIAAIWPVAAFMRTVNWRGNLLKIGDGTQLERVPFSAVHYISDVVRRATGR